MRVKNWDKYQHFKNKEDMKWFKLYGRDLLNDPDFMMLDDSLQATLIKIWCLASESNGRLPQTSEIAFRLRKPISFIEKMLLELNTWLIEDKNYIEPIHKLHSDYIGEEIRRDKIIKISSEVDNSFKEFWDVFPSVRKIAKAKCEEKWYNRKLYEIKDDIINHVQEMKKTKQWKEGYSPAPMTYINQSRWLDPIESKKNVWEGGI